MGSKSSSYLKEEPVNITEWAESEEDTSWTASEDDPLKVAIIGSGVAGLGAAWHLAKNENIDVTVFEAADRAGGHAETIEVVVQGADGKQHNVDIDTGFMVFNDVNYPNMVELFKELDGVEMEDTVMSFSVSLDDGKFEWGSDSISSLLAHRRNALSPQFYIMLKDVLRFNADAPLLLALEEEDPRKAVTVGEYLKHNCYSPAFVKGYLIPMAAAIWSSSSADVMNFSAFTLISFMHNHRMLQIFRRPQWKTPAGRSKKYVSAICKQLGPSLRLNSKVSHVYKDAVGKWRVQIEPPPEDAVAVAAAMALGAIDSSRGIPRQEAATAAGAAAEGSGRDAEHLLPEEHSFDQIIFACHADTALEMLGDAASQAEVEILSSFDFATNDVIVHSDERLMPKSKKAWSAWNYIGTSDDTDSADVKPVFVTYWLNRLQNLDIPVNIFVSLNPTVTPDPDKVLKRLAYSHPQFSVASERAQSRMKAVNGQRRLWFCGAWMGYGFHEDGLRAGLSVATAISRRPVPWVLHHQKQREQLQQHQHQLRSSPLLSPSLPSPPPSPSSPQSDSQRIITSSNSSNINGGAGGGGGGSSSGGGSLMYLPQPAVPTLSGSIVQSVTSGFRWMVTSFCTRAVHSFLKSTITTGYLTIRCPNGRTMSFGDVSCIDADKRIRVRVFDWWFFVRVALEYDLGLARSYMAGEWVIDKDTRYCDGLRQLFLLFVDNRDSSPATGMSAGKLVTSWVGYFINFLRLKWTKDNSLKGSRSNIEAHYDLSNELFATFLDQTTMMYSSAIFDAQPHPSRPGQLVVKDTLESAQVRKIDLLLRRCRVKEHHRLLDIGFGWGGIAIRAAETIGCQVVGITLSVEQKAWAEERVKEKGLEHLITFELIDYRIFAEKNEGAFDRIVSCEMIEAVGHRYLGNFFKCVDAMLKKDGVFVMEGITTPECRYEEYLRSSDFINAIIFPGSCCPSLTALMIAMADNSSLSLEGFDNINLHYAETLKQWRYRFNDGERQVRSLGFDDVFIRCWNYYFSYCEAGFCSQTEGCLILTFSRPGNVNLINASDVKSLLGHN